MKRKDKLTIVAVILAGITATLLLSVAANAQVHPSKGGCQWRRQGEVEVCR